MISEMPDATELRSTWIMGAGGFVNRYPGLPISIHVQVTIELLLLGTQYFLGTSAEACTLMGILYCSYMPIGELPRYHQV